MGLIVFYKIFPTFSLNVRNILHNIVMDMNNVMNQCVYKCDLEKLDLVQMISYIFDHHCCSLLYFNFFLVKMKYIYFRPKMIVCVPNVGEIHAC